MTNMATSMSTHPHSSDLVLLRFQCWAGLSDSRDLHAIQGSQQQLLDIRPFVQPGLHLNGGAPAAEGGGCSTMAAP